MRREGGGMKMGVRGGEHSTVVHFDGNDDIDVFVLKQRTGHAFMGSWESGGSFSFLTTLRSPFLSRNFIARLCTDRRYSPFISRSSIIFCWS